VKGPSPTEVLSRELEKLYELDLKFEDMPEAAAPSLLRSRLHMHQVRCAMVRLSCMYIHVLCHVWRELYDHRLFSRRAYQRGLGGCNC
jgi:hypothetical protein